MSKEPVPISQAQIPGCEDWLDVTLDDGRRYFYNGKTTARFRANTQQSTAKTDSVLSRSPPRPGLRGARVRFCLERRLATGQNKRTTTPLLVSATDCIFCSAQEVCWEVPEDVKKARAEDERRRREAAEAERAEKAALAAKVRRRSEGAPSFLQSPGWIAHAGRSLSRRLSAGGCVRRSPCRAPSRAPRRCRPRAARGRHPRPISSSSATASTSSALLPAAAEPGRGGDVPGHPAAHGCAGPGAGGGAGAGAAASGGRV